MSEPSVKEISGSDATIAARWECSLALCKPNVILLVIFTAIGGMLLSAPAALPVDVCFFATVGIGLAAA